MKIRCWLKRVIGRRLPPPPPAQSTTLEAEAAKTQTGMALRAAHSRSERVDKVVADLRQVRQENGFGARLAYAYGLRSPRGNKRE